MRAGDLVTSPRGMRWRVLVVTAHFIRAQHIDTGVVSHFLPEDLTKET